MTNKAVGWKTLHLVIGHRGCEVLLPVAIDAIVADAIKTQSCFRVVAIFTARCGMPAQQRKAVLLVQFRNIIHQPVGWRMTTRTIGAHGLLVDVDMAGDTFRTGI